jgi:hypothetical protein
MIGHQGHDIAHLTSRRGETALGRVVCLDCEQVIGPLMLCGARTRRGGPCRVPVRIDLGYETCMAHAEGRDRTNQPRRRSA